MVEYFPASPSHGLTSSIYGAVATIQNSRDRAWYIATKGSLIREVTTRVQVHVHGTYI